jgi:pimeloyl-ACP methyl ester carboxylesterase
MKSVLYYPDKQIFNLPLSCGITYEDVEFAAADGTKLHAWYSHSPAKRGTILYCHGNGGNICWHYEQLRIFNELGFDVFIFDYRGYGLSEGEPDVEGTYSDVEGAWSYLESKGVAASSIVVWGRSMGGPIAARCASLHAPGAFVGESTFTALRAEVIDVCVLSPLVLWPGADYPTIEYVKKIRCPVLVIHSGDDTTVQPHHGREIFSAANEPKAMLWINGSHNGGQFISRDRYISGVDSFMKKYFDAKR